MEAGRDDDERRLRHIEQWFRERGVMLVYDKVGDPKVVEEWVALMVPDGHRAGVVDGGGGKTKLAAAEDAQARYRARHGSIVPLEVRIEGKSEVRAELTVEAPKPGRAVAGGFPPTQIIEPPSVVHERALGMPTVTAIPPDVREPLDKLAGEYGWYVSVVEEPDGTFRWFVFDSDRKTMMKTGVVNSWDDALLEMMSVYPPSEDGRAHRAPGE